MLYEVITNLEAFMVKARRNIPFTCKIEIEAETFEQARQFMQLGADIVMCDNMTPVQLAEVVAYRNSNHPAVLLEASGNITLETIEAYAQTGVDAISTGARITSYNVCYTKLLRNLQRFIFRWNFWRGRATISPPWLRWAGRL